ncbi:MAG: hypothetical protein ACP5HG_05355 [Anaerolineae bacterium]
MTHRHRILTLLIVSVVLLSLTPARAAASVSGAPALAANTHALPPLPEWPIVGPLLQRLGVVAPPPPVEVTPDPTLPEYRITDFEDLEQLEEIEEGERVRIVVTEADLNRMIAAAIEAEMSGEASAAVGFDTGEMVVDVSADASVLEQSGLDIPRQFRGDLDLSATLRIQASQCMPEVAITRLRLNRWGLGLRPIAQRALDTSLPEIWPGDLCVERVILSQDEAAVEGFRGS